MTAIKIALKLPGGESVEFLEEALKEGVTLGSGKKADVLLEGAEVDKLHAQIELTADGKLVVRDLKSASGIKVNGVKVPEAELQHGLNLDIGGVKISCGVPHLAAPEPPKETPKEEPKAEAKPEKKAEAKPDKKPEKTEAKAQAKAETKVKAKKRDGFEYREMEKRREMPELYKGKPPPKPVVEAPDITPPSPGNRQLEVAQKWKGAPVKVVALKKGQSLTIGTLPTNTFVVGAEVFPQGSHVLFRAEGQEYTVDALDGMKLKASEGGKDTEIGKKSHQIGNGQTLDVQIGDTTFSARYVGPQAHLKSTGAGADYNTATMFLVSIFLHVIALTLTVMFAPSLWEVSLEDANAQANRFASLMMLQPPELKEKKEDLSGVEEGAKAKDEEGKFGKKEEKQETAAPSKSGAQNVDPNKKEKDREKALNSGILGALGDPGGSVSNVFGPGGLGEGINDALGGLTGTAMGTMAGVGGLGSRGAGGGGGGTAQGIGGLGTKGSGHGKGGYGKINLGGSGKSETKIIPGKMIMLGGLDKDVIQKVIQRHWNQIKYCYEKELNKNPDLAGKIVTAFTIGPDGKVQEAHITQTEMNNESVESCMVRNIQRWVFPQPKGGGVVVVTYPWIFQAS